MAERIFGDIPGYPEGSTFVSREELSRAGVHKPIQAGISGSQYEGADSIVLSGGYEDDADYGDVIVYTGHGGRDSGTGKQVSDQALTRGNLALAVNRKTGLQVRVIRGSRHALPVSPLSGYLYDGLFRVDDHWKERGHSKFLIWRFRLVRVDAPNSGETLRDKDYEPARRIQTTVTRVVRHTQMTRKLKKLYDYRCQICGERLVGNAGPYAEAAHIRPLGTPHHGPDVLENMLCLCPTTMCCLTTVVLRSRIILASLELRASWRSMMLTRSTLLTSAITANTMDLTSPVESKRNRQRIYSRPKLENAYKGREGPRSYTAAQTGTPTGSTLRQVALIGDGSIRRSSESRP